jgi:hypothetical protein
MQLRSFQFDYNMWDRKNCAHEDSPEPTDGGIRNTCPMGSRSGSMMLLKRAITLHAAALEK